MALNKWQITIDCENCRFEGCNSGDPRAFFVRVNIQDKLAGQEASALLECRVEAQSHLVQLVELSDGNGIDRDRLARILELVSEKRLCGNARICPAEIARMVGDIQNETGTD